MLKERVLTRIIAVLAAIGILTSCMSGSVYAASAVGVAKALSGDEAVIRVAAENKDEVQIAYEAIQKSAKTHSAEDIAYAEKILRSLSETNRVRLYVKLTESYYYANYKDLSNKYFNAYAYLRKNADVAELAAASDDPMLFALEHYLTKGIFEGRSSCTSYDPVIAILVNPDSILKTSETGKVTPSEILKDYTAKTGSATTDEYTAYWTGIKGSDGVYSAEPLSHTLHLKKAGKTEGTPAAASGSGGSAQTATETPASDSSGDSADSEGSAAPASEKASLINKSSGTIVPYKLDFDNSNVPNIGPNGDPVYFSYYSDTYNAINDSYLKNNDKDYTFMIYMCGSNQENNDSYVRVTKQLLTMLKAGNLDNVNVLVCVGGSPSYSNDYMGNETTGIINDGVGVYYLDTTKVTEEYNKLSDSAKAFFNSNIDTLASAKLVEGYEYKKQFEAVTALINENTFKKLSQLTSIDMGDPALLSGFINYCVEYFPASDYGLSLSDHGNGWEGGVCLSEDTSGLTGTVLTMDELESALNTTVFANSDQKLGLLYFDACLMGSTEVAYNLKDYYKYMLASEEVTWDMTDYETMLKAISTNSNNDCAIAEAMLNAYTSTSVHHENVKDNTSAQTMAVFSSDGVTDAVDNLNTASRLLTEVVTDTDVVSSGTGSMIYEAVRKTILSCYDYFNADGNKRNEYSFTRDTRHVVDLGEFTTYLIKNLRTVITSVNNNNTLTEEQRTSITEKLEEINEMLAKTSKTGLIEDNLTYALNGLVIASSGEDASGNKTVTSSADWKTLRGNDVGYIGASLLLPIIAPYYNTCGYYNDYLSAYNYSGSGLADYIAFMKLYSDHVNGNVRNTQVADLKEEMKGINYAKLITPVTSTYGTKVSTVSTLPDSKKQYISFKIADSYESAGVTAPVNTLGSPMLDMLETSYALDVTVVHQEKFNINGSGDTNAGTLTVNMICGEAVIAPNTASLDNGTVDFYVDNLQDVAYGYSLYGTAVSGTQSVSGKLTPDNTWQYVLKSDYSKNSQTKSFILSALSDAISEGLDLTKTSNYMLVTGNAKTTNDGIKSNVQHVFSLDSASNKYNYQGSVLLTTDDNSNIVAAQGLSTDNITEISAYHYILVNDTSDTDKLVRKCLETDYSGIESGYYSVSGSNIPYLQEVYIKQATDNDNFTTENNGYVLSLRFADSEVASSYTDILKLDSEKYDAASNFGSGLLSVDEAIKSSSLQTSNDLNSAINANDGYEIHQNDEYGSNINAIDVAESTSADTTVPESGIEDSIEPAQESKDTETASMEPAAVIENANVTEADMQVAEEDSAIETTEIISSIEGNVIEGADAFAPHTEDAVVTGETSAVADTVIDAPVVSNEVPAIVNDTPAAANDATAIANVAPAAAENASADATFEDDIAA